MADDKIVEICRQIRTAQDKYDYFLLAVAASAVAFALNRTQGYVLSWSLLSVGIAVFFWGLSFFFGCRHLEYVTSSLHTNAELIKVTTGVHPEIGPNPVVISKMSTVILEIIEDKQKSSVFYATWQFRFLIFGALAYITWHILEMYHRIPK